MPIIDKRTQPTELEAAESQIRLHARRAVIHARRFLAAVRAQAEAHGRDALQTQLGTDAAQLADLYRDCKAIAETYAGDAPPSLAELPADPTE
jgi:hypothetical protein